MNIPTDTSTPQETISLSTGQRLQKRLFDVFFSTVLLVLTMPLMLLITLALRIESGGPILYRMRRYTYAGKSLSIFKFRTMRFDSDEAPITMASITNDPRVTRVGAFLRKTSLDELPQLFSVLGGSMSIVGPRPKTLVYGDHYREQLDTIIDVAPGITGWSQLQGARGQTGSDERMREWIELDLYYVANWSMMFDLKVLWLTVVKSFRQQNAY